MPNDNYVVLTTLPNRQVAESIACKLVQQKLAACVNMISGLKSFFWWNGKLNKENEVLLVIKTSKNSLSRLEKQLKSIHPYQVPEIIGWPIKWGEKAYLDWVSTSTKRKS